MVKRTVKDIEGRTWTCTAEGDSATSANPSAKGQDVKISCTTESVAKPVIVTVGWQWEKTSDNGLARMIALASPVAKN
jgi:hypothetical protein